MKYFVSLGTECVEFLKAARASQGKLFSLCLLSVSLVFPWLFVDFPSPAADALTTANAHIASLEAKLEASRKAWDVATAAKVAAEKSAKSAAAKAKKVENALDDADQGHAQREQAIAKHLNQISTLAGGKYLIVLFICSCLVITSCLCLLYFCRVHWSVFGTLTAKW
jgi:hypothetical protein